MKPEERKQLAEKFAGLDKILYERLEAKVGKLQPDMAENVGEGIMLGMAGLIPIFSTVSTVPLLMRKSDRLQQELERSFSVDEVKEIVAEQQKQINHKL